jgi:hypothetical protein
MAPEVLRHERYSLAVDLWSLGVVLFILLSGRVPFPARDSIAAAAAAEAGAFEMAGRAWEGVSSEARGLVAALLAADPAARPAAAEVLAHPWLHAGSDEEADDLPPAGASPDGSVRNGRARLRTVDNLRQLSRRALDAGGASPPRRPAARGSRGASPGAAVRSPLRDALDYDLALIRLHADAAAEGSAHGGAGGSLRGGSLHGGSPRSRRGSSAAGSVHGATSFQDLLELERLRVRLSLVGGAAGIGDARAATACGGAPPAPGSPAHVADPFAGLGDGAVEEDGEDGGGAR